MSQRAQQNHEELLPNYERAKLPGGGSPEHLSSPEYAPNQTINVGIQTIELIRHRIKSRRPRRRLPFLKRHGESFRGRYYDELEA